MGRPEIDADQFAEDAGVDAFLVVRGMVTVGPLVQSRHLAGDSVGADLRVRPPRISQ